uniref:Uncharacterized protein n=1 Tax=Tetranychus urticae TaxID=32264 RepID=T1L5B8_TETUR
MPWVNNPMTANLADQVNSTCIEIFNRTLNLLPIDDASFTRFTNFLQLNLLLKGVLIQEVELDQPCLRCFNACPGYQPHSWR